MKKVLIISARVFVSAFALVGVFLTGGFFAVKWKLTDVSGAIDQDDRIFADLYSENRALSGAADVSEISASDICRLSVISSAYPENGSSIIKAVNSKASAKIISSLVSSASRIVSEKSPEAADFISKCDYIPQVGSAGNMFEWTNSEEWKVFEEAVRKDEALINEISGEVGVPSRFIVGELVGEQLRLFNSEREAFKKFFAPLKILGNETKFSLGVTGIKEETAIQIENNLKDRDSVFYPGSAYEKMLDFKTDDHNKERVDRLTDKKDRRYPYLYTALFIKQIEAQWSRAGYPIDDRPEIIGTLWNIGFNGSKPNPDPKTGGSLIRIGEKDYTFGSLVYGFYYSGRLVDEFPYR